MKKSLSQMVDRLNHAFFWGEKITKDERGQLARTIAETHARPNAYARTFALDNRECKHGIQLFTGERVTNAAARHISGEEACRALRLLKVRDRAVQEALDEATENLQRCLDGSERATQHRMGGNPGIFCCGRCSVSVWRHVLAGGFDRREERLRGGVQRLKESRDDSGRWGIFPFWYTLSALVEMDFSQARQEIKHVATMLERAQGQVSSRNEHNRRRIEIARRALELI